MEDLNRIKVMLAEHKQTSKWLSQQLGKSESTVSKWCQQKNQPDLQTLYKIAQLLNVDIKDLVASSNIEK